MRPHRTLALLMAFALLQTGCARVREIVIIDKPPPRVALKGYPLDISFGDEPIQPQEVGPQKTLTAIAQQVFEDYFTDEVVPRRKFSTIEGPPSEPCPPPGPTAVARVPISSDIKAPPAEGVYLFHQEGTIEIVGLAKQAVSGLTSRIVRNVVKNPNGSFTYDVDQTIGSQRVVITYAVTPGSSLAISRMVRYSGSKQTITAFAVPATVFTLPVTENTSVTGAGVDPVGGQSMLVQALTDKKQRIEGCEQVADGWHTSGRWQIQGAQNNFNYTIDYTAATQHGGLLIADNVKFTESQGAFTLNYDITTAFGHIDPKPEPPK